MAHDVFISYSHYDVGYAEAVCQGLEKRGLRCWMAPRDIPAGDNFAAAIVNAINTARVFLLIFSSASNTSEHVAKEVNLATGRPIFYIRTEDVKPIPPLEYYLSDIQWMDGFAYPGEGVLDRLAAYLRNAILHRPPRHKTTIPGSLPVEQPAAQKPSRRSQPLTETPLQPVSIPPAADPLDPFALPETHPTPALRRSWLWIGLVVLLFVLGLAAFLVLGNPNRNGGGPAITPTATLDRLSSAQVQLINSLDVDLTVHLTGQGREYTYQLAPGQKMEIYVLAGTYQYLMEAEGFNPLSGEKTWEQGDWEWEFYVEPYTPTP